MVDIFFFLLKIIALEYQIVHIFMSMYNGYQHVFVVVIDALICFCVSYSEFHWKCVCNSDQNIGLLWLLWIVASFSKHFPKLNDDVETIISSNWALN